MSESLWGQAEPSIFRDALSCNVYELRQGQERIQVYRSKLEPPRLSFQYIGPTMSEYVNVLDGVITSTICMPRGNPNAVAPSVAENLLRFRSELWMLRNHQPDWTDDLEAFCLATVKK